MADTSVKFFTDDQVRRFVVIDTDGFRKKAEALAVGFSAAALSYWADLARSTFSPSTAQRYIESLFWNPQNPEKIQMSVMADTLADLLEGGQDERDLTEIFLKSSKLTSKGKRYRIIPIDYQKQDPYLGIQRETLGMDVEEVIGLIKSKGAVKAKAVFISKMNQFEKAGVPSKGFERANPLSAAEKAVGKESMRFRTITPESTWRHPGIRAALLSNQVAEWMRLNRTRFSNELFGEQ